MYLPMLHMFAYSFLEVRGTINRLPLRAYSITYYVHTHRRPFSRKKRHEYFVRRIAAKHATASIMQNTRRCFIRATFFSRDEKNSRSPPGFAYILICDYTKETLWLSIVLFDFQMRLHARFATRIYAKIYGNCIVSVHLSKLLMAIKLLMRDCSAKR